MTGFALAVVFVAVFLPPTGVGVPLCYLQWSTGVPCPGCGMMRSLSWAARGHFTESIARHPFGFVLLFLAALVILARLVPRPVRGRLQEWLDHHDQVIRRAAIALVALFFAFGVGRAVLHVLGTDFDL